MKISTLTPVEEQLMLLLWKLDTFYLKDILVEHPEPKPHQNTISTYMKILVEKKFLTTEKEGRIFRYQVAIKRTDYAKFLLKNWADHYFSSHEEFVDFLKKEKFISNETISDTVNSNDQISEKQHNESVEDYLTELTKKKKKKKKKKK